MGSTPRTPEQQRLRRISHLIMMGLKLVLLGMVFLFALDNAKPAAVAIGVLLELGAVTCFVKAYRAAYPKPPLPAAPYTALQESMQQMREHESPSPGNLPARSPLTPR